MKSIAYYAATAAGLFSLAQAVHPIEVRGQDFVDSVTNKRFMVIGVDYQPGGQSGYKPETGQDPLSDGKVCLRDAIVLQSLGVNTIRVYNVDPSANHDECASIWNAAGIYMLIDVNSPLSGESIDRSNPKGTYTKAYMTRVFSVVEAFKNYKNTLGFFAGNEIINDMPTGKDNPPIIRAVQRDLKNYIAKQASRTIPVGYSAADVREILGDTWAYLQCQIDGKTDASRSDFFGLNSYSWCGGDATFTTSGYSDLVALFSNTTIPVFFSEYGCNKVQPRVFDEVQALYSNQMTVLSGGLVYEYSQEEADYGLVTINGNSTVSLMTDFDNLQAQYNKLNLTLIESANSTATSLNPPKCSAGLITDKSFSTSFDIPNPPSGVQDLINNGIPNPPSGKFVDVKETALPYTVYSSKGAQVKSLALKVQANDGSNTPGNESLDPSSTSSGASPSSTSKQSAANAGFAVAPSALILMGLATLFML